MNRTDFARFFVIGGAGVLTTIYLALIALQPQEAPDYLVKGLIAVGLAFTFVFGVVVLSDWFSYLKELLSTEEVSAWLRSVKVALVSRINSSN
jgi:putative flippase GtrA